MDDASGDYLAERSTHGDRGGYGSEGEIEAAGPARQIGDHQDRYDAKDPRSDSIQNLCGALCAI